MKACPNQRRRAALFFCGTAVAFNLWEIYTAPVKELCNGEALQANAFGLYLRIRHNTLSCPCCQSLSCLVRFCLGCRWHHLLLRRVIPLAVKGGTCPAEQDQGQRRWFLRSSKSGRRSGRRLGLCHGRHRWSMLGWFCRASVHRGGFRPRA